MEQISFGTNDFAENPEPRVPCVLVLDVSGSMAGPPIDELNEGLKAYFQALSDDSLASKRVEVAIVTFGGEVNVVQHFTPAYHATAPELTVTGDTPLGQAINVAIDLLDGRKREFRSSGTAYYRPWMILITDGAPTDNNWQAAATRCLDGEKQKAFACFPIGVEGANFDVLKQFTTRAPLKLRGTMFRELFVWLSSSQQKVSRSTPGDEVPLANPTTPDGWATIS